MVATRTAGFRECAAAGCGRTFALFNGKERACGPRCAGDLARQEHADLRLDTYRKQAPALTPSPSSIRNALEETRAVNRENADRQAVDIRDAVDMLNGRFNGGAR